VQSCHKLEGYLSRFTIGVLNANEAGASYEGVVYDRFLTFRHTSGIEYRLFDPPPPISSELVVGACYELALESALPRATAAGSTGDEGAGKYVGVAVNPRWRPGNIRPLIYRPSFFETTWILLQTALGQLLVNPNEIVIPIGVGDTLRWESTRFDLQAVIRRCDGTS
jgi:hypothetical protein